jgi:hypothetical protein
MRLQCLERSDFVGAHQAAIASDIRGQYGRQSPFLQFTVEATLAHARPATPSNGRTTRAERLTGPTMCVCSRSGLNIMYRKISRGAWFSGANAAVTASTLRAPRAQDASPRCEQGLGLQAAWA